MLIILFHDKILYLSFFFLDLFCMFTYYAMLLNVLKSDDEFVLIWYNWWWIKLIWHLGCIVDTLRIMYNFYFDRIPLLSFFFFFDFFFRASIMILLLCNMYAFINLTSFHLLLRFFNFFYMCCYYNILMN